MPVLPNLVTIKQIQNVSIVWWQHVSSKTSKFNPTVDLHPASECSFFVFS